MNLTNLLSQAYSNVGLKTKVDKTPIFYMEPIIPLTEEQERQLLEGDGQKKERNEYKQINSSTGLAVNYYKILESLGKIEGLRFEEKVEKPLKIKGGRCANLDVVYQRDGRIFYVESKFLEPYYSSNEHNTESYFKKDNYDVPDNDKDAWYALLADAQNYKIYNFSQICRHLMAIWRKHKEDRITFQSVMWEMTEEFISTIKDKEKQESLRERISEIKAEASSCHKRINEFLRQIKWDNIIFECVYYNEIKEEVSSSKYYSEFLKRYFL